MIDRDIFFPANANINPSNHSTTNANQQTKLSCLTASGLLNGQCSEFLSTVLLHLWSACREKM